MTARKFFGTDGIRGTANTWPVTPEIAMRLGMAAATYFRKSDPRRHLVVIGKDTRLSGYMLEPALTAGFTAKGMDVVLFGPLPTPGVAMLTRSLRADLGVMISASHNSYQDNGIKLFGPDGYKLSDDAELAIEALMARPLDEDLASPPDLGRAQRVDDAQSRYVEIVKSTFPRKLRLSGLRVVIDCANGAAYKVAPKALYELGAEVFAIGDEPNGFNINREIGSTDTRAMVDAVHRYRADIGIALDGDADRVVMCDEHGRIIDGDQLLGLIASSWKAHGLRGPLLGSPGTAGQHHLDDLHGGGVSHPQAILERRVDTQLLQHAADLRPAAMNDHRVDAEELEEDDVAGEEVGQLLVLHGMAAILDDDRLPVIALDVGQRL